MELRPRLQDEIGKPPGTIPFGPPAEDVMTKAGSVDLDLRFLPQVTAQYAERPERQPPAVTPTQLPGDWIPILPTLPALPEVNAPAPSPSSNFAGLDYAAWANGAHPPDPNGDVGPAYYIQAINTAVGVYRKTDGVPVAQFTFNSLMKQGHFGNPCDTNNYGDPVVLYDTFEDRWILTDFAFQLSGNDVVDPPGSFQCFAVSKTGDPVSGGWNFYSINTYNGLGDYPKFGIWPDGLYMTANMFDYKWTGSFQRPRMYAFNKAQMYAGAPSIQIVSFDAPPYEFTILPANARLQAGAPPAGSPNYCAVVWNYTNAVSLYKFHLDWNKTYQSSFTGPFYSITPTAWNDPPYEVPSLGGSSLDTLADTLMPQNQYTNQGGVESVWLIHTVMGGAASIAAPRYYQVNVTGGTVASSTAQAFTFTPDNTLNRFMSSLAVDRAGDMAIGYSTTGASSFPAIKYAGRLATDPVNTLPQTEVSLIDGTGSQTGTNRWGDYTAMTLDPDGCRFWYTNMYYATTGLSFLTRIGAFAFPSCTPLANNGTLQGTITAAAGGAPVGGASIAFGARSATTDASGFYAFAGIPAGTYPSVAVSKPGYVSQTTAPVVMTDSGTTTRDFVLAAAAQSACFTDTSPGSLQTGAATLINRFASSGNATPNAVIPDQQSTAITTMPFNATNWVGQTFLGSNGEVESVQVIMDCKGCSGTTPDITISLRAASGDLPTGPDLATATMTGFNTSDPRIFLAHFSPPLILVAGAKYAVVGRPVSNPSTGTYEYAVTSYPDENGRCVTSADSGASWIGTNYDASLFAYILIYYNIFESGLKDSNPAAGLTPVWSALSWTGTTPPNSWVQFQIAGSNSEYGPFNYVGPDGTNATYFTSNGASLSQFYGLRYLKYKAFLSGIETTAMPKLDEISLCYDNVACPLPVAPTISGPSSSCGGGSITLTSSSATGNQWLLNSTVIDGATGSLYVATVSGSYTVRVTGASGCRTTSAVKQVSISNPITVYPSSIADSIVGASLYVPLTITGGAGNVTFSGSLPAGLQISNGTLIGGPGAGTFTFTITATDANGCTGSRDYTYTVVGQPGSAPASLRATANGTSQVIVTWTPVLYATGYEVLRNGFLAGSPVSNSYVDTQGIVPGTTYVYRVRAMGSGFPGTLSAPDIATTVVFTDDPIVAGSTLLKGVHLTELRAAVNAVRAAAGLTAAAFTDAAPTGRRPKALYVQELRAALGPARSILGVPAMIYSNAAGVGTVVRAVDLTEIRDGVK